MSSLPDSRKYDVAIIGGGPAGSVAAAWLARRGRRVIQLEKERFPRFHIGESLLPNGNGVLKEIGVWEKVEAAGFVDKRGAEFTLPDRSRSIFNIFANGIVPGMERAFQVERARFDDILFQHAKESGSDSRQEVAVSNARFENGVWNLSIQSQIDGGESEIAADWIIDASGRNAFMGRRLGLKKEELPYPGRVAIFNHFRGVPRAPGERGGDIIVMRLKDAWFWVIPISTELTSIGVVAHKGAGLREGESREAFFRRKVGESSWLEQAIANAEAQGEFRVESDYSFSYESFGAEKVLLAGDAASFIDPVFSSGVYLAMTSGLLAGKLLDAELRRPNRPDPSLYARYTKELKDQIAVMRRLIDSYYDNATYEVFMTPKPPMSLGRSVNSVLAGCLKPPLSVRWRLRVFEFVCRLHKRLRIVPKVNW